MDLCDLSTKQLVDELKKREGLIMDKRVIFEDGVVRMTLRQLCNLWMDAEEKCSGATDIIDIQQPTDFTDDVSFSLFEQGDEKH